MYEYILYIYIYIYIQIYIYICVSRGTSQPPIGSDREDTFNMISEPHSSLVIGRRLIRTQLE